MCKLHQTERRTLHRSQACPVRVDAARRFLTELENSSGVPWCSILTCLLVDGVEAAGDPADGRLGGITSTRMAIRSKKELAGTEGTELMRDWNEAFAVSAASLKDGVCRASKEELAGR